MRDNLLNSAIISHEPSTKGSVPIEYGAGQYGTYVNEFGQTIVNETLPKLINQNVPVKNTSFKNEPIEDVKNTGTSNVVEPEITNPQKSEENSISKSNKKNNSNKLLIYGSIGFVIVAIIFVVLKSKKK